MGTLGSQITSLTIVYSTVYSDADQRKHQSSASLAFVRGIHRGPVNSLHKWPVTQKMFLFDDVTMKYPCDSGKQITLVLLRFPACTRTCFYRHTFPVLVIYIKSQKRSIPYFQYYNDFGFLNVISEPFIWLCRPRPHTDHCGIFYSGS